MVKSKARSAPIASENLNSTAVVEGDIYHRSLAIEENAQFEGMSRRQENVIDNALDSSRQNAHRLRSST